MKPLFTAFLALGVACATGLAHSQATNPAGASAQQQAAAAAVAGSAASIEAKVAMCMGCHNLRGYQASFPEVHKVPMIAGQSAKYIAAALTAYKNGDRKHPTMRGLASSLSEQDIATIASYYEALPKDVKPLGEKPGREPNAQVAGLLQKAACASCHGANYSKPIDPSYPKLAGQHADYLFVALKAYKVENNPAVGRNNGVMGAIAKQFSNAELKALANYMASLDSELRVHPESRFR